MVEKIENLDVDLLDLPPSCIEFWPSNHSWFIVGTYELDKSEDPARTGATRSRDGDIDARPFTLHEGNVSPVPLSFHNYSEPNLSEAAEEHECSDDRAEDGEKPESEDQTQPSTLQERNGSLMLYNLENGTL
jgi:diphthamide biosynthesis protein 7